MRTARVAISTPHHGRQFLPERLEAGDFPLDGDGAFRVEFDDYRVLDRIFPLGFGEAYFETVLQKWRHDDEDDEQHHGYIHQVGDVNIR